MKAVIVSGIWPPDVGGPASHAPELAAFLCGRGHEVAVVTTADVAPSPAPYGIDWVDRRLPVGARHLAVTGRVWSRSRRAHVVYATSMVGRSSLGATLAQRPFVAKVAGDAAYERALRRGLFDGDLPAFQSFGGGLRVRALRAARNAALRRAARIVCPSDFLRELVVGWGVPAERAVVVPNPAPDPPLKSTVRDTHDGRTLAFAGRLTTAKALDVAFEALERVEGVSLLLAGDGPERGFLERRARELGLADRVRFLGPLPRDGVLELFGSADATILSSSWENFPHTVVESFAVGTPVIATRVGGVAEVVVDGENGLLVPPGDPEALAAAIRRLLSEPALRERLASGATPSVAGYGREQILGRIEAVLVEAAGR